MTNKSAKALFEQAWAERFEELGISPAPSLDRQEDFVVSEGEKSQLRAMQKLADYFMASPGFTGLITQNGKSGLALVIARGDVDLVLPFECRDLDPEYTEEMKERFFFPRDTAPAGYTSFTSTSSAKDFASSFAEAATDERKGWHDMTDEQDAENIKELIVAILADKVAAVMRTRASLDFIQTIKPRI